MAKVSARGCYEVGRYVDLKTGTGMLVRSDGAILMRRGDSWVKWRKLRTGVDPEVWFRKMTAIGSEFRAGLTPPSFDKLEKWEQEGRCKATDGCWVEPDGDCPHGWPSWLKVRGMI